MMSTAAANLSVGPPYDVGIYLNDSYEVEEFRIEVDAPVLERLRGTWERHLLQGVAELQTISHEDFAIEMPKALTTGAGTT